MYWKIGTIAALIILAGALNGVNDTLWFHYDTSPIAKWENQQFWNPQISWENKYERDAEGRLVRPLRPRFIGSTTVFVFVTDAWHLVKELHYALYRTAFVLIVAYSGLFGARRWWTWAGVWIGLWALQAIGFHITYSIIL